MSKKLRVSLEFTVDAPVHKDITEVREEMESILNNGYFGSGVKLDKTLFVGVETCIHDETFERAVSRLAY